MSSLFHAFIASARASRLAAIFSAEHIIPLKPRLPAYVNSPPKTDAKMNDSFAVSVEVQLQPGDARG